MLDARTVLPGRISMKRAALALVAFTALAVALGGGIPRLIGTGCNDWPTVKFAIEESDFRAPCATIRPIWSN